MTMIAVNLKVEHVEYVVLLKVHLMQNVEQKMIANNDIGVKEQKL